MGLLDSLFNQSTYGGQQGGLLDMLRSFQTQQQYQHGAGFASDPNQPSPLDTAQYPAGPIGAPSSAMAQMPAGQNTIGIGSYQMPRIGDPQQFTPDPAALPQNAQPTQGQIQPQQAPPMLGPQPQIPALGGDGFNLGRAFNPDGLIARLTGNDPRSIAQRSANMTARALIAKGVDPVAAQAAIGSPELMKALITQTYGPQTIQSLGSGYIADKNGKITRAYEPDDRIPVGFQKTDNGLQPIPGGPADLAYVHAKSIKEKDPNALNVLGRGGEIYKTGPDGNPIIVHKNAEESAVLDDQTTSAMAAQYLAGDKSVMTNLGRGAQGAANIVKMRTEIYKQAQAAGLDGKDIVNNFNEQAGNLAGQRSIGTRSANISLAANEANNMIPIALKASESVPRGEWMPWNKMVQAYQTGSSSPELARFVAATNSLVNSYVRAVSPSGVPTDSMREHAYSMLNSAQSAKAYKAVTDIMQEEMQAAMEAPGQVRKELRHDEKPADAQPAISRADAEAELRRRGKIK